MLDTKLKIHVAQECNKADIAVAGHGPKRDLTDSALSRTIHILQYKDEMKLRWRWC